ncbi:MAG: coenzyme F420-0:L-glutamate ligase [Minisyncoccales bacterium]
MVNPNKKLKIKAEGREFARYPIQTHFIKKSDSFEEVVSNYVVGKAQKRDIVVLSQKIVSIMQGRILKKEKVKISFLANFLSKFVKKTPVGFGVGNPYKMQVALNLAGRARIIFAAILGGMGKLFGIHGVFYKIAGNHISEIDGFYGKAFKKYKKIGILGPKNCDEVCERLKDNFGFSFVVADINDIGGKILGKSSNLKGKEDLLLSILRDNPAGQSNQRTPIILIREL